MNETVNVSLVYDYSAFILINLTSNKRDTLQPTLLYKNETLFTTYVENATNVRIGLGFESFKQYIGKELTLHVEGEIYDEIFMKVVLQKAQNVSARFILTKTGSKQLGGSFLGLGLSVVILVVMLLVAKIIIHKQCQFKQKETFVYLE